MIQIIFLKYNLKKKKTEKKEKETLWKS